MALWMNLGTINVVNGSKAVTGVGTKFKTAPIPAREGQPIVINNVHYEIGSVNSDTSITLALNYAGATANNLAYTVITTAEGSFNDLSRRAAQVMSLYQGYMDVYDALFSGTGNVTVTLPDGDVVTLPAWNTMQPKDSTLTSLSGKPVKTFGIARLGDADAAAQLTALGVKKAGLVDILGTLTAPGANGLTSAIIERGGNANGTYVKFADGTMICQVSSSSTEEFFATGVSGLSEWNFEKPLPAAFNGAFACAGSGNDSVSIGHFAAFRLTDTSARCSYRSIGAPGSRSVIIRSVFIGRWYA